MGYPRYIMVSLRLCTPARDWHKLEDCVEERYQRVLQTRGPKAARRWAMAEAVWFVVEGAKRILTPNFWIGGS
ncbi:MAG: hypothetical protein QOC56_382 [Alphaproteobacteria bacterium]|nr:hypothetical protein [Alphaproteobacteria bacterium]